MVKAINAVQFHSELNPKLWTKHKTLDPEVRYALLKIAKTFLGFINIEGVTLKDICFTGSNAAYAYTKFSDIDLHLIVDMHDSDKLAELYDAKKSLWNLKHNLKIHGIPIEVYVQDSREAGFSNGVYSVLDDRWISEPLKVKADLDDVGVKNKYDKYVHLVKQQLKHGTVDSMNALRKDIKRMRQTGLAENGEFGVENITFKLVRNYGWIGRLMTKLNDLEDRELSLEQAANTLAEACWNLSPLMESRQDRLELRDQAREFVEFAIECLELDRMPRVVFTNKVHVGDRQPSFGQFDPNNNHIMVSINGRHVMDVFRTLAHELVHYRQNLQDVLHDKSGETGSEHENEANAIAGVIMRKFATAKPDFFSKHELKENRPSKVQPTARELKTMAELYRSGMNAYKIGNKFGQAEQIVSRHLKSMDNWSELEAAHLAAKKRS